MEQPLEASGPVHTAGRGLKHRPFVRFARGAMLVAVLALVVGACGDDDDESSSSSATSTTTTAPSTTTTTTPPVPVKRAFASPVDATVATQAATTMTRRLEKFGNEGSKAVVNSGGTGLDIAVAGVTTTDEANAIVDKLSFKGIVLYRPVLAGPFPPAAGETPSAKTYGQLGVPDGADLTTLNGYATPTTPAAEVTPASTAVIPDMEYGTTNVIIRWQVGPSQLDGTSTNNTQLTTIEGSNAVKIVMANSPSGLGAFNTLAEQCFSKAATCPGGAYAVQFDSVIAFAATVRPDDASFTPFTQDDVIVSSPTWTEEQAALLAIALEAGALPVGLVPA